MKINQVFKWLRPRAKCYEIGISTLTKDVLPPEMERQQESREPWLKCRYIIAVMGFIAFFFLNAYRMNLSVAIVAMVNSSVPSEKTDVISDSCPVHLLNSTNGNSTAAYENEYTPYKGTFNWSPKIQGYIHGSYYLGYVLFQVPIGKLVERHGCKWFFFWGTFIAAVATLAVPHASRIHAYVLIVAQFFRGIGQAVYQPASAVLTANWFPKMERGLLYTIMQSGCGLGAFLGSLFTGLLCESELLGGWSSSFYAFGIAGLLLSCAIVYLMHENPSVHPRISQAELKYILSNQENALSQRRPDPPWSKILSSVPVYALAMGYFGQFWAVSQFLIVQATFLGTILHYPIEQNGFLSALPFLLMFVFAQSASWLSSFMTNRKYASIDQVRKFCHFISCLGFSLCILGVYFVGCDKSWSSVFSALSVGFTGFGLAGVWIVSADMSPTFAASVNAFSCTLGCLPSFILPLVVGYLTNERQTLEQWNKVFFIAIGIVMASGFIFSFFGSAEIQPWNSVEENQKDEQENARF